MTHCTITDGNVTISLSFHQLCTSAQYHHYVAEGVAYYDESPFDELVGQPVTMEHVNDYLYDL